MTRYGLRDDQWERIKNVLPGRLGDVGATAGDNRRFVEAVLYRYRAGIPWRDRSGVTASAAMILAVFGDDIGTMTALADHALALSPTCARRWYYSGFLSLMAGEPSRAIKLAEISLRLSPRTPSGPVHTLIGAFHFLSRRFNEAIPKLLLALEETPNFPVACRYLAACYARMGRLDAARDVVKRLRAVTLAVMPPDIMYLRDAQYRELYLSGLRLAAGEAA